MCPMMWAAALMQQLHESFHERIESFTQTFADNKVLLEHSQRPYRRGSLAISVFLWTLI